MAADRLQAKSCALLLANRLMALIEEPYQVEGQQLAVGVSIGISLLGMSAIPVDVAIKRADRPMYRAKQAGGSAVYFADSNVPSTISPDTA